MNPEFADHPFSLGMNMHLLVTIKAVKEKSVWPGNALDCRHIDICLKIIDGLRGECPYLFWKEVEDVGNKATYDIFLHPEAPGKAPDDLPPK